MKNIDNIIRAIQIAIVIIRRILIKLIHKSIFNLGSNYSVF